MIITYLVFEEMIRYRNGAVSFPMMSFADFNREAIWMYLFSYSLTFRIRKISE